MNTKTVSGLWSLCYVACAGLLFLVVGCSQPPELPPATGTSTAAASSGTPPSTPSKKCTPPSGPSSSAGSSAGSTTDPDDGFSSRRRSSGDFWWRQRKGWALMNKEERALMMKREIHPRMWLMFRRFDAKYDNLKNFHCGTCHGQINNVTDPDFSKPSSLYPLDPNNMPTVNDCDPKMAKMVRFMKEKVVPAMQDFVQNSKLDCFSCHAKKGS